LRRRAFLKIHSEIEWQIVVGPGGHLLPFGIGYDSAAIRAMT
jgi:hypothetical protein